jgi:serine/threonine protein kinase
VLIYNLPLCSDIPSADFSKAVKLTGDSPTCNEVVGNSHWQAPEIRRGPYDPFKADIWSLGVTVYEMAEAELPSISTPLSSGRSPPLKNPEFYPMSSFLRMCLQVPAWRASLKTLANVCCLFFLVKTEMSFRIRSFRAVVTVLPSFDYYHDAEALRRRSMKWNKDLVRAVTARTLAITLCLCRCMSNRHLPCRRVLIL